MCSASNTACHIKKKALAEMPLYFDTVYAISMNYAILHSIIMVYCHVPFKELLSCALEKKMGKFHVGTDSSRPIRLLTMY